VRGHRLRKQKHKKKTKTKKKHGTTHHKGEEVSVYTQKHESVGEEPVVNSSVKRNEGLREESFIKRTELRHEEGGMQEGARKRGEIVQRRTTAAQRWRARARTKKGLRVGGKGLLTSNSLDGNRSVRSRTTKKKTKKKKKKTTHTQHTKKKRKRHKKSVFGKQGARVRAVKTDQTMCKSCTNEFLS